MEHRYIWSLAFAVFEWLESMRALIASSSSPRGHLAVTLKPTP